MERKAQQQGGRLKREAETGAVRDSKVKEERRKQHTGRSKQGEEVRLRAMEGSSSRTEEPTWHRGGWTRTNSYGGGKQTAAGLSLGKEHSLLVWPGGAVQDCLVRRHGGVDQKAAA